MQLPTCRSGGIGRRDGFKIRCPQGRVGSIPTFGTHSLQLRLSILHGFTVKESVPVNELPPWEIQLKALRALSDRAKAHRGAKPRAAQPLASVGQLLAPIARRRSSSSPIDLETWQRLLGPRIADHCRPTRLKQHVLSIRVASAPWAQELTFFSSDILKALQGAGVSVKSLRFYVAS